MGAIQIELINHLQNCIEELNGVITVDSDRSLHHGPVSASIDHQRLPISAYNHGTSGGSEFIRSHVFRFT
jgi:hypothetical protein